MPAPVVVLGERYPTDDMNAYLDKHLGEGSYAPGRLVAPARPGALMEGEEPTPSPLPSPSPSPEPDLLVSIEAMRQDTTYTRVQGAGSFILLSIIAALLLALLLFNAIRRR